MQISESNKPIAENIQRILQEKGLKQCSVAERAGFTSNNFNAMLKGRRLIKPCDIEIIAKTLEVPINKLYERGNG